MSGPANKLYMNGDGNIHTGRREEDQIYFSEREYEKIKTLEKQIDDLLKETNELKIAMKETRTDMKRYNGLHEDRNKLQEDNIRQWKELTKLSRGLIELEAKPCRQTGMFAELHQSIDMTNTTLNALTLELSVLRTQKETQEAEGTKFKHNIGQYLGWAVAFATLLGILYDKI